MWGGVVMLIAIVSTIFRIVQYCSQDEVRIPAQPMKTNQTQERS
jgi:hypothetical protein